MIAKDQFVDALTNFDMRLRFQKSRPKSLNEAIRLTVFCKAERQRRDISYVRGASGEIPDTQETNVRCEFKELRDELRTSSLRELELKIAALTESKFSTITNTMNTESPKSNGSFPYKCHNCGTKGHRSRDCFAKKRAGFSQCMSQNQKRICPDPLSLCSNKQKRKHLVMCPFEDDLRVVSVTKPLSNLLVLCDTKKESTVRKAS